MTVVQVKEQPFTEGWNTRFRGTDKPVEAIDGWGTVFGRGRAVAFMVGVLALAACTLEGSGTSAEPSDAAASTATASSASPAPSPSPSASASPTTSPSPVPVTGPEQKLVTMTVSGGFAGIHQQLILRGDGTVYTSDQGEPSVRRPGAARFEELRTLLGDPALDEIPAFTMDMGARDMFQYTLEFDGRTIITDRSSEQPALDRLIAALGEWLPEQ